MNAGILFDTKMHNVLLVYKQISLQFDKEGNLLAFEGDKVTHVLSYDKELYENNSYILTCLFLRLHRSKSLDVARLHLRFLTCILEEISCTICTSYFSTVPKKTGIQVVANKSDDLMPNEDDGVIMRDYEYKRLGTISLLAGIDLQTGGAISLVSDTHTSDDYIAFLKIFDGKYPKDDKIRLVLDNLKVHSAVKVQEYFNTIPGRFEFVFTPKHASKLNLVEGFFSKMTKQMLKGIRVNSKQELCDRIYKYFEEVNEVPVVYHWTWNFDDIDPTDEVTVTTFQNV